MPSGNQWLGVGCVPWREGGVTSPPFNPPLGSVDQKSQIECIPKTVKYVSNCEPNFIVLYLVWIPKIYNCGGQYVVAVPSVVHFPPFHTCTGAVMQTPLTAHFFLTIVDVFLKGWRHGYPQSYDDTIWIVHGLPNTRQPLWR